MEKTTISMVICHSYVKLAEGRENGSDQNRFTFWPRRRGLASAKGPTSSIKQNQAWLDARINMGGKKQEDEKKMKSLDEVEQIWAKCRKLKENYENAIAIASPASLCTPGGGKGNGKTSTKSKTQTRLVGG